MVGRERYRNTDGWLVGKDGYTGTVETERYEIHGCLPWIQEFWDTGRTALGLKRILGKEEKYVSRATGSTMEHILRTLYPISIKYFHSI